MNRKVFTDGIGEISKYFGQIYHEKAVMDVWSKVREWPDSVMEKAIISMYLELSTNSKPSMQRVFEFIATENRTLNLDKARSFEDQWNREKGADSHGRVSGSVLPASASRYSRVRFDLCLAICSGLSRNGLVDRLRDIQSQFPEHSRGISDEIAYFSQ